MKYVGSEILARTGRAWNTLSIRTDRHGIFLFHFHLFKFTRSLIPRYKWVPVTTAWRVLRLRMEERPPMWMVAANMWNKQSRKTDKGWSSSSPLKRNLLRNIYKQSLCILYSHYCFSQSAVLLFWRLFRPYVHNSEVPDNRKFRTAQSSHRSFHKQVYSTVKQSRTAWSLNMGPTGCLETSVNNPRNTPEERKSHLHCVGNLKPRIS